MKRKILTTEEHRRIYRELAPLAERIPACIDCMRAHGFSSFVPRFTFRKQFCAPDEAECFWQVTMEQAKAALGGASHPRAKGYVSPLLERLYNEWRARLEIPEGTPLGKFFELNPGLPAWDQEILPWKRREAYALINDAGAREVHKAARAASESEVDKLRIQEVARHATELSKSFAIAGYADPELFEEVMKHISQEEDHAALLHGDFDRLLEFYKSVMASAVGPLGFELNTNQSSPKCPVFSKLVAKCWYLSWSNEMFAPAHIDRCFDRVELALSVRSEMLKGPVDNKDPDTFLEVKYASLVPGFYYRNFATLAELETAIRASSTLYACIAPELEAALQAGIG